MDNRLPAVGVLLLTQDDNLGALYDKINLASPAGWSVLASSDGYRLISAK